MNRSLSKSADHITRVWRPTLLIWLAFAMFACWLCTTAAWGQGDDCLIWEQRANTPSLFRKSPALAYDSSRKVAVLFGGRDSEYRGDTWEWDGVQWTQRITEGPAPRGAHAMVYDSARGVVVLFAGIKVGPDHRLQVLSDTWEWDGAEWVWRDVPGPSPRFEHAMAYDIERGVTVVFGGRGPAGRIERDTWEWDGAEWTFRTDTGPSLRSSAGVAYDHRGQVTVLFGGANHNQAFGDTWEWNGLDWTQRLVSGGPLPRSGVAMLYDAPRGVSVLFGGRVGVDTFYDDTWEWDGVTWAQRGDTGPSGREHHAMAYDIARGAIVLFGGIGTLDVTVPPSTQTWEFPNCLPDFDIDDFPDPEDACPRSDLHDVVAIEGCDTGVANVLLKDGCTLADLIVLCAEQAGNHGAFVSCVSGLCNEWVRAGLIADKDKGRIHRCAAHADIPAGDRQRASRITQVR